MWRGVWVVLVVVGALTVGFVGGSVIGSSAGADVPSQSSRLRARVADLEDQVEELTDVVEDLEDVTGDGTYFGDLTTVVEDVDSRVAELEDAVFG